MATHPETQLVAAIKETLAAEFPGALIVKLHGSPFMTMGLPDLLMVHDGKAYAFEVKHKRASESPDHARARCTAIQSAMIGKFRRAGAVADVVLSPSEALAVAYGKTRFHHREIGSS